MAKYYEQYNDRYLYAVKVGLDHWGYHLTNGNPDKLIESFIEKYSLSKGYVAEFGCGEGLSSKVFERYGIKYDGYDIAENAINKANNQFRNKNGISFFQKDLVNEFLPEALYDAVLDMKCIHMLIIDKDRDSYLHNMCQCLKATGVILSIQESTEDDCQIDVDEIISFYEEGLAQIGYSDKRFRRRILENGEEIYVPMLPSRSKSNLGYRAEFAKAGLTIINILRNERCTIIEARKN